MTKSVDTTGTDGRPKKLSTEAARYLLAFLILPNLGFYLLGQVIFLARPLLNVDYLLTGLLWSWFPLWLDAFGFALVLAVDFVMAAAPVFHFKTIGLVQSILDSFNLDPTYGGIAFGAFILSLAVISAVFARMVRRSRRRWQMSALMIAAAVAVSASDLLLSANVFRATDNPTLSTNLATSSMFNVSRAIRSAIQGSQTVPMMRNAPSASAGLFKAIESNTPLPPRIMLVVVEAMGVFLEPAANSLQASALDDPELARRYRIERNSVEFAGSTVPGELRELCRIRWVLTHPDPAELPSADCLPAILKQHGYSSIAAHGFSGSLFDRNHWYPALDFDEILFIQNIDRMLGHKSRCGVSFPGACDAEVVDLLGQRLRATTPERLFVYWMTLNAHLPVYAPPSGASSIDCAQSKATQDSTQCNLVQHHDIVLQAVRKLALSKDLQPTLFIVVGDHMPPYLSKSERKLFDQTHVPYFILWPKDRHD